VTTPLAGNSYAEPVLADCTSLNTVPLPQLLAVDEVAPTVTAALAQAGTVSSAASTVKPLSDDLVFAPLIPAASQSLRSSTGKRAAGCTRRALRPADHPGDQLGVRVEVRRVEEVLERDLRGELLIQL